MNIYPKSVWRVEINYLSNDYENKMLSTSSPFKTYATAAAAYFAACKEFCVDDPAQPARVAFTETTFPAPGEWGTTKIIKSNQ